MRYGGVRRGGVLTMAIAVGAVVVVLVCLAGCDSPGPGQDAEASARTRAAQARAVARQAGLDPSVQDFMGRAAAASSVTSTVVYQGGGGQTTVVMSRPPDRRIDILGAAGPGSADRVVVRATQTSVCHVAGTRWTCVRGVVGAPGGPFTPDAVTQAIAALVPLAQTHRFTVSHRSMVGLVADCLAADRRPDRPVDPAVADHAAICIAPSGVILRVEGDGTPLQATSYRETVPAGAFQLPAPASPAPVTGPPTT